MKGALKKGSIALLAAVALFLFAGLAIAAPQEGNVQDSQFQNLVNGLGIDFLTTPSQELEPKNNDNYPQIQNSKPQLEAAPPNGQQVEPPCTQICVDGSCGPNGPMWGYTYCAEWTQQQIDAVAQQAFENSCPMDEPPAEDPPEEEPPSNDPPAGDPPAMDPPSDRQPGVTAAKLPNTGTDMVVFATIALIIATAALVARRYASKKTR